ncbi:Ig-like domain-containing protein [Streptomyces sp. 5-10]|uniref:Ig-like domain-containing protein n=1 Tax=Streptomyces sp. 5-10 TaxID=878925 RepID=UPI00168AECE3|nr:Ig-like domain-containing protein [Streptomyces sp. 5-10]MBD3006005.1 Ig-like domain-containing protein [Streptomyces sp. 5-10]
MSVAITPASPVACTTFTAQVTAIPAGVSAGNTATFTYDGQTQTATVAANGTTSPVTFTAVGTGPQTVTVVYTSGATITGTEVVPVTVTPAPPGTLTTTLTVMGTTTHASTTLTCAGGTSSINGTIQYTLPGGGTVSTPVVNGVVTPVDLGVLLTSGQSVTATFVAAAGTCPACTFAPVTTSLCTVVLLPPAGVVTAGQPTTLQALVLCNGVPVSGATVSFSTPSGTLGTGTTNASGLASATVTFPTAGATTVTATVTATPAGTTCSCTGTASAPLPVVVVPAAVCTVVLLPPAGVVTAGQPTTLQALVLCNGVPVSGATVSFSTPSGTLGTGTTNASGLASATVTFPTAGATTVTATVTATPAGSACNCTGSASVPLPVVVLPGALCTVVLLPPAGLVTAGQPTTLQALVLCNGVPVSGATVTFSTPSGTLGTGTTNAAGLASATVTFPTAGATTVTATVTATPAGSACNCTGSASVPLPVVVLPGALCTVVLLPPAGLVTAGQPTTLQALVLCNGVPVSGATVTFSTPSGTLGTGTTNAAGLASATVTFPTAGATTVTATVTATPAGSACNCTGSASVPLPVVVLPGATTPGPLQALPACWRISLTNPTLFPTTLTAKVTPPTAGISVQFLVGGVPVGTATTDATGTATLPVNLTALQILNTTYQATAVIGGTTVTSTASLLPCVPPV